MQITRSSALLVLVTMFVGLVVGAGGLRTAASAHEEREAVFPDGAGKRPQFLGLANPERRVVCRPQSRGRIAEMPPGPLKRRNKALLRECGFGSIQTAINSIDKPRTSVYVLPGYYTERRWATAEKSDYCADLRTESDDPLQTSSYIGSLSSPDSGADDTGPVALSYADQLRCPHNLNLIAILGDETPEDDSIACDGALCGTQLVGTGRTRTDVVVDNRFAKLNAIRADRAGGVYFRNFTVQQAEFNALYVLETDGFVVDRVVARANDEYGVLAFASDHGLIQRVNAYWNGDSGIYPGSASDVNGDNQEFEPTRYSIEIRRNDSHHNALGYSGTAGNSVWAHHNDFHHNATGIATDSLFPGHPGLPQDHARWNDNRIFSNNENYYERYVDTGVCAKPIEERGYLEGTVCPVIPTPVGTGVLIAGGNFNSTDHNWIYDNWRYGTMQFWVPSPLRDEYDPTKLYDTSNGNRTFDNLMGIRPGGSTAHNGLDHWWDDQGVGNCWEDNESSREGGVPTTNFLVDPGRCADGGSVFVPGAPVKDAGFLSCSQYDRNDELWRHPPECSWFETPQKPTDDQPGTPLGLASGTGGPSAPLSGPMVTAGLGAGLAGLGLALALGVPGLRRRTLGPVGG